MSTTEKIDTLIIINVSGDQMPTLARQLIEKDFHFTQIDSSGGLLHVLTNSLLVGINRQRYPELKELIHACCRRRRTHIAAETQMDIHLHPAQPIIIEAEIGGATLNTLDVEYFEQF
ncbi:MAG: cyclic-di-AMP receptor [Anaerolineales bacterium]|nr:cyclic-di-AMP receptor [Anaerolineales bacterium]